MWEKFFKGIALVCLIGCLTLPASASEVVISDGVMIAGKDVGGMTVSEVEAYVNEQVEALSSSTITIKMGSASVSTTWGELGLAWENTDLIAEISEVGTTGNIITRYKQQKDLENQNENYEIQYSLDAAAQSAFVNSLAAYNCDAVEGTVYQDSNGSLVVEGGTNGYTLDASGTLEALQEYLSTYQTGDAVITASYTTVSPIVTAEMLSQMTDVLGTATTSYASSSASRAQNVQNGTNKINGTLLLPGESYSVTEHVTPFTAENGYGLAASYEAGQVVESYGGGICQVSTTLYNAVLKAELQVDKRYNHTMTVSYVDPSKDAAIAEGLMDFQFTNNSEYPIYIAGSAYSGTLTFTIYGVETRPSNRTLEFVSETLSTTDASSNISLIAVTDQSVGYISQIQSSHNGLSAVLWKKIYIDGVLTETIQVNSSTYTASAAIYEVGVATSNSTLQSAMYAAIASNSLSTVQSLIANGVSTSTTESTEATETTAQTTAETTATEAAASETTAPETTATEAAVSEDLTADQIADEIAADSGAGETVVVE